MCTDIRDQHEQDRPGVQSFEPEAMRRAADRIESDPGCSSTQERRLPEALRDLLSDPGQ
jgi:hypothetical protein